MHGCGEHRQGDRAIASTSTFSLSQGIYPGGEYRWACANGLGASFPECFIWEKMRSLLLTYGRGWEETYPC